MLPNCPFAFVGRRPESGSNATRMDAILNRNNLARLAHCFQVVLVTIKNVSVPPEMSTPPTPSSMLVERQSSAQLTSTATRIVASTESSYAMLARCVGAVCVPSCSSLPIARQQWHRGRLLHCSRSLIVAPNMGLQRTMRVAYVRWGIKPPLRAPDLFALLPYQTIQHPFCISSSSETASRQPTIVT
ncbi:hypothetical protein BC835DRAFT_811647 [Cytidiella melzeri]|nr:hypothetical protein BC835DRAFT_811647 [Cytidiella melzeri]